VASISFSQNYLSRALWLSAFVGSSGLMLSQALDQNWTGWRNFVAYRLQGKTPESCDAFKGREVALKEHLHARLARLGMTPDFHDNDFVQALCEAELRFGVSSELMMGVAEVESGFRASVRSTKGAVGLYQILPRTAGQLWPTFVKSLPKDDPIRSMLPKARGALSDPRASTLFSAFYLARLGRRYKGDLPLALAAYNVGPTKLNRAMKEGERPGMRYARKVLSRVPLRTASGVVALN
jgi:hypothetical protein